MASLKQRDSVDPEGFTMTPMIDVVFQLLIFFMLITDMSRQQLAQLILPSAGKAIEEQKAAPDLLVVNVLSDGRFQIGGQEHDKNSIKRIFQERRAMREHQDHVDKNFVKYPLMIRADGGAAYEHAQWLLMAATRYGRVTKLQICVKKADR